MRAPKKKRKLSRIRKSGLTDHGMMEGCRILVSVRIVNPLGMFIRCMRLKMPIPKE